MELHAVYATCTSKHGTITFRVGLPVAWAAAQARWERLDARRRAGASVRVRWARRWYRAMFLEVRAVDRHGRGLGSDRHSLAFPVPYRYLQSRKAR
jgi:hypothetical protein